jgi:hypothetical protein
MRWGRQLSWTFLWRCYIGMSPVSFNHAFAILIHANTDVNTLESTTRQYISSLARCTCHCPRSMAGAFTLPRPCAILCTFYYFRSHPFGIEPTKFTFYFRVWNDHADSASPVASDQW